jgi:hypothetical protein
MEAKLIFYTIQGLGFNLEVQQDQIRLVRKSWFFNFSKTTEVSKWEIKNLKNFEISSPKSFLFSGEITWETVDGESGHFNYSTSPLMVKKIATYIQKRILKNQQRQNPPIDQLQFMAA